MDTDKLRDVLAKHVRWFHGSEGGELADLSGADLSGADLRGAELTSANLRGAKFWRADFQGTDLRALTFFGSSFRAANLRDANLGVASFYEADLTFVTLSNANLTGAWLKGVPLTGAWLWYANLGNANLSEADLSGTQLSGTILCGANLYKTNFSGDGKKNMPPADWSIKAPPMIDRQTRFIPKEWEDIFFRPSDEDILAVQRCFSKLTADQMNDLTTGLGISQKIVLNSVLNRRVKSLVQLADAAEVVSYGDENGVVDMEQLQKVAARYHVPMVTGAHQNADLSNRPLVGAFVDHAHLSGANLSYQNLSRAVISHSALKGTNLRGADLTDAVLSNVDLTGADLRDVNLSGAILVNCLLDGVKLDGVVIDNTRMIESTLKNIRLERANIKDWLIQRSIVDDLAIAGGVGGGVNINGLGLYDSVMINSRFDGNCQIGGIELEGSLMIIDGGGLLNRDNVYVSPMSEWREQRILLLENDILGAVRMERVVETGQIENKVSGIERMIGAIFGKAPQTLTGLNIYDLFSDEQGPMGHVPALEHLRNQKIGYQPAIAINKDWQPAQEKKIDPAGCTDNMMGKARETFL